MNKRTHFERSTHNPFLIWCDVCTSWRDDHGAAIVDGTAMCRVCQEQAAAQRVR